MAIKGLEKAINNLNSISRTIVPDATVKALNRVIANGVDRKQVALIYDVAVCSLYKRLPVGNVSIIN